MLCAFVVVCSMHACMCAYGGIAGAGEAGAAGWCVVCAACTATVTAAQSMQLPTAQLLTTVCLSNCQVTYCVCSLLAVLACQVLLAEPAAADCIRVRTFFVSNVLPTRNCAVRSCRLHVLGFTVLYASVLLLWFAAVTCHGKLTANPWLQ
jgi:hypothetical protein